MLSKINHGSEWEVTENGREKEGISVPNLATWTAQTLISQHTYALPVQGACWLPLPSVPLKEMNSLSLLHLLTSLEILDLLENIKKGMHTRTVSYSMKCTEFQSSIMNYGTL